MKRYLFTQWLQRIIYGGAVLLIFLLAIFFVWYVSVKPFESKIILTDYSKILLGDQDCSKITSTNTNLSEQFPLTLMYNNSSAELNFDTETDFFVARLQVLNAENIIVTIENQDHLSFSSDADKTKPILLPQNEEVVFEVKARRFRWSTNISSFDFEDVKGLVPQPPPTPAPTLSPLEALELADCLSDCGYEAPEEFDWIDDEIFVNYSVGLCGENLAYYPKFQTASLDNLYSVGMNVLPTGNKAAFLLIFDDLVDISINGKSIPTGKEAYIRIVTKIPDENAGLQINNMPNMNIVVTQITSKIRTGDYISGSWPGVADKRTIDAVQTNTEIYPPFSEAIINAERLFIDNPSGSVVSNYPKNPLPDRADQLTIYSTKKPLKFELNPPRSFRNEIREEFIAQRIGASLDGRELFPSPWESLPREIQVAFITVLVPICATLFGYGIKKKEAINGFFGWLFSIPHYMPEDPPILLHPDAHIFNLLSGRKISGLIVRIEGKWWSPNRTFVLREAREWKDDRWSEVLADEVILPRSQIEMYYKNQP